MWRLSFTLLILLNLILGGMLFWQWKAYSEYNEDTRETQKEQAIQKITVETKKTLLEITQLIDGLKSEKEYKINMPENVIDWTCLKENGEVCEGVNDNSSIFKDNRSIKIIYNIELHKQDSPFLLTDWIGTIQDVKITNTVIEVIDSTRREGTWVTGFPLKGYSKLNIIDYYVFEGHGGSGSLYWQPIPLDRTQGEGDIQYYGSGEYVSPEAHLKALKEIPDFSGISIILTENYYETNGKGLMVVRPNIEESQLERKIIHNYFFQKSSGLPLEERWIVDVLTSLLGGYDNNLPKRNEILKEIKSHLSEVEIKEFMNLVFGKEHFNPQILDELLGGVVQKKTNFFVLNKNEDTQLVPLFFNDVRQVFIQEKQFDNIEVLLKKEKKLFPFLETMNALGFEVKILSDEETLLLNKGNNSYRFYVNQNIFIYNQEDYGLLDNPLVSMNGTIYMDSSWLESIFQVIVEETNEEITLSLNS